MIRVLHSRYGYRGFYDKKFKPINLTRKYIEGIQLEGGTFLGTSRGGANIKYGLSNSTYMIVVVG